MNITYADPVHDYLQQVEALIFSQPDHSHSNPATAFFKLIASGGKRIRPRLALLVGSMLGANKLYLITLAAAIEMLHNATLVHDDLVDNSLLRRGMATLNAHYSSIITVLVGDYAFARAAKLASNTQSLPVMNLFAETLMIMADGELTQACRKSDIFTRAEYYRWIHAKTASMFELATGAAALLSPVAHTEIIASARKFGSEIGMAFQIVDDILDFTGNRNTLGKPTGNDLRQGVITLPTLCYLDTHPDYPITDILQHKKDKATGSSRIDQLILDICKNGAIDQAYQEADGFIQRGLSALATLPDTPERHALAEIARSVICRNN